MKLKRILFFLFLACQIESIAQSRATSKEGRLNISGGVNAQSRATSEQGRLNISRMVKPPIFELVGPLVFIDNSGNNAIDANESCRIRMTVINNGIGDGKGLVAKISATGSKSGLKYGDVSISPIKVGETREIDFFIRSTRNITNGRVEFAVKIEEPLGFGTETYFLTVDTKKYMTPLVKVVDYTISGERAGELKKYSPFDFQILVQNTEYGDADSVKIDIDLPENVFLVGGTQSVILKKLNAGKKKSIVYQLIVSNDYANDDVPITINLSEKLGRYAQSRDIVLKLDQPLASNKVQVRQRASDINPIIQIGSLRADVDKNIPFNSRKNPNRFALIIGNEDYHSYQRNLQVESDVAFAVNDATTFSEYCTRTLGVEEKNVVCITNATAAEMSREIERITRLVEMRDGRGELIFFYAGHGFPGNNTKEPFLIPVDVSASNLNLGINLHDLYNKFSSTGAKKITVFMDACFSGGGRNAGLLASRGIKIVPKKKDLKKNIVVFSATQKDQTALPYTEKQHGMFTYFLLKKIQDTNGECSYEELSQYITDNVTEYSIRENNKDQNPETNFSYKLNKEWGEWKFVNK